MKRVLVTGGAGFIGSHLVDELLEDDWHVTTVDNLDPFYDPVLKRENIAEQQERSTFEFRALDIQDSSALWSIDGSFDVIVHLAAKAGVRPSILDPIAYQQTNVQGTQNLLEFCRQRGIERFVFASSSSVYGVNPDVPWTEATQVLQPISPYAATKTAGELLGHVYSHLYGIRFIALRLFTVYGPRQRPDLAIRKFARLLLRGEPLTVYGDGTSRRDYTYVEDVTGGIRCAMEYCEASGYEIINLGNNHAVSLVDMVHALEEALGVEAELCMQPVQPGDVPMTCADIGKAQKLLGWQPRISFEEGIERFAKWAKQRA